jgi:hypothetical protein
MAAALTERNDRSAARHAVALGISEELCSVILDRSQGTCDVFVKTLLTWPSA